MKDLLPTHLQKYVVEQNYQTYTWEDHSVWRYIIRQLKSFMKDNAHLAYLEGLKKTGLEGEMIPRIDVINEHLNKFGWSAVAISGFIPPAAFMEFQSLGYLPVATDIRTIDHIHYTPAPDIVHESAGHAPILIDPKFSSYLKSYAQVAKKAIFSKQDLELYEAIRTLSDLKENPNSTEFEIKSTEQKLHHISNNMKYISEAAYLSRMNWWTAEYGLIGPLDDPKIFGAGLLSSIGESRLCLGEKVEKLPLSIKCLEYNYDITEPQPQLFVADTFDKLTEVLEELAKSMAFSRGGLYGLEKALESETVNTIELNSGLQLSGILEFYYNEGETINFIKLNGPSQISYNNIQLDGHGVDYHSHGYSSPIGELKDGTKLSQLTLKELKELGIYHDNNVTLEYASGITLQGTVKKITTKKDSPILISFTDCKIQLNDKILFDPSWGEFDLALGEKVSSVFGGAADRENFEQQDDYTPQFIPPKIYNEQEQIKHSFYKKIRDLREKTPNSSDIESLYKEFLNLYPEQWLMGVELYELSKSNKLTNLEQQIHNHLMQLKNKRPDIAVLIDDGIKVAQQ